MTKRDEPASNLATFFFPDGRSCCTKQGNALGVNDSEPGFFFFFFSSCTCHKGEEAYLSYEAIVISIRGPLPQASLSSFAIPLKHHHKLSKGVQLRR